MPRSKRNSFHRLWLSALTFLSPPYDQAMNLIDHSRPHAYQARPYAQANEVQYLTYRGGDTPSS